MRAGEMTQEGARTMGRYVQTYTDEGDAICSPHADGGWWFWCEHEQDDHHRVLIANEGGRVDCSDCGTGWVVWQHAGKVRAKAVVVRVG